MIRTVRLVDLSRSNHTTAFFLPCSEEKGRCGCEWGVSGMGGGEGKEEGRENLAHISLLLPTQVKVCQSIQSISGPE